MSKYKLTQIPNECKKNLIELCLEYEHGDADMSEKELFSFEISGNQLDSFSEFYNKLELTSNMIDQHRVYSGELDRELLSSDNEISHSDFYVELPRDCIYSYEVVAMSIAGVVYYDGDGEKYTFERV